MRREDRDGILAYGSYGRPMIDAVAGQIEAGRLKVYCVDSWDSATWHNE